MGQPDSAQNTKFHFLSSSSSFYILYASSSITFPEPWYVEEAIPEAARQAAQREKKIPVISPALDPTCHNINLPDKMCPLVEQCRDCYRITKYSLTGYVSCSTGGSFISGTVTLINIMVREVIGPMVEPTIIIFLNCHVVKLTLTMFISTDLGSLNFGLASY